MNSFIDVINSLARELASLTKELGQVWWMQLVAIALLLFAAVMLVVINRKVNRLKRTK